MDETSKNDWQRTRSVFEDVLLQPTEERRVYAQKVCGANEILWNEVRSLLDWHEGSESFLETPAVIQIVEDSQLPDQLIAGQQLLHYEIRKLIGKGGMGEVYLARDTRLDRNVAVKLLRRDLLPHLLTNDRLLREARAAALLEHPNICNIHEISEADGFSFIVMQYVVGTTLDDILAGRGIDVGTALDLGTQIAGALAEAHSQGIIHRDIKPANVIVSEKGQAKILDFGLAKFIEAEGGAAETASRMESSSGAMGTVPYMSPEQVLGDRVDARTDVFSFGTMLFEMFSGVSAFGRESNAETISAILNEEPDWSRVPPFLRPLLQRCLAKNRAARFLSGGELAEAIVDVRSDRPIGNPTRSNATGPNPIDAVTDPGDRTTRPLYFWQSAENEIVPSLPGSGTDRSRFLDNWIVPFAISSFLAPLVIGLANTIWRQTPSPLSSVSQVPVSQVSASFQSPVPKYPTGVSIANGLIAIPGGTFTMGRNDGHEYEKPAHEESVRQFRMDKTEVTNAEYYEFVKATGYGPTSGTQFLSHWKDGRPIMGEEDMPVRYVNIDDVNAYARWLWDRDRIVYRLPTEQEWEFAARNGTKGNLYPWGDSFDARCAFVDQDKNDPALVGSRSCPNEWGVVDLIGNVFEWTSTTPWLYADSKGMVILPTNEARYMVRGGAAKERSTGERAVTSTWRTDVPASKRNAALGFRLVTTY